MHWKLKAQIQNTVAILPSALSYSVYYWLQRSFGTLKPYRPISRLNAGIETWKRIQAQGYAPAGKIFLEVGTGRVPLVPLAYWLMGAEKTITIDLNPYLKAELIQESLQYITQNQAEIQTLFGDFIDYSKFDDLLKFSQRRSFSQADFLNFCQIEYIAPGDATCTGLAPNSIDFHTSYTVFEHIPLNVLQQILLEGNRIIKQDGLFIHKIDYSDHFSHSDKSISAINFLQYSDQEWQRYADNRYMYMNRLRHDDFLELFASVGHQPLDVQTHIDWRAQTLLAQDNLPLHQQFQAKTEEVLAITEAWLIFQKNSKKSLLC